MSPDSHREESGEMRKEKRRVDYLGKPRNSGYAPIPIAMKFNYRSAQRNSIDGSSPVGAVLE